MTGWWMCRYYVVLMELVLQGLFLCPLIIEQLKIGHYWRFRNSVDSLVFILVLFFPLSTPKAAMNPSNEDDLPVRRWLFWGCHSSFHPHRPLLHELADVPRALFCTVIIHVVQQRASILSSLEDKCNINTTSVWEW